MDAELLIPKGPRRRVKRALALTLAGLWVERILQAFWPVLSLWIYVFGLLFFGMGHWLPPLGVSLAGGLLLGLTVLGLWRGGRRFSRPTRREARDRVDALLPGRPLQALEDTPLSGAKDPLSRQLWDRHVARMADAASAATSTAPTPALSRRDPYALRLMALFILAAGVIFGTANPVAFLRGGEASEIAQGPIWEGWIEPPAHTGAPTLYMADLDAGFDAPKGASVTIRLYGDGVGVQGQRLRETVSGRDLADDAALPDFSIAQAGEIEISGPTGRMWQVALRPDAPPVVELVGPMERAASGEARQSYRLQDDIGVERAELIIDRDLDAIPRRYGYIAAPEERPALRLSLNLPQTGNRRDIEGLLAENLSLHAFSGLPVTLSLRAFDASGQVSDDALGEAVLPGRRFFDPLAGAIVDVRRELLWTRSNAPRAAQVLRASLYLNDEGFSDETIAPRLRAAIGVLETEDAAPLSDAELEALVQELWDIASLLEDGELAEALERLRRAQERLQQAMRDGASKEEIARLMQELREATQQYLEQLAEQQGEEGGSPEEQSAQGGSGQELGQDQIQALMDRIQELMEQGRMAEAQALMEMLNELLENLRVTQSQGGEGGSGGQQMQGLQDMLRDQQDLNDDTFSDLQEQRPPQNGQGGAQGGPQGGAEGQDENDQGEDGQSGQNGENQNQGGEGAQGAIDAETLAQRQEALRQRLEQQRGGLTGGENADEIGDALDEAERAMEGAEQALRDGDLGGALGEQAEAMEALREGMRQLGQELAGNPQEDAGEQGEAQGQNGAMEGKDPLGRTPGNTGSFSSDDAFENRADVYRRAEELVDEIRRRSAERERDTEELGYLKRLLDRF